MNTDLELQNIIKYGVNMFYKHTADHTLTYVSPQCTEFLGCTQNEALKKWTDFITDHPINKKGFNSTQKAIDTGKTQPPFELQLRRKDGKIIWVLVNESPVIKDGRTISIIGALTNITEQKEYQRKLKRLSLIASKTSDLIVMTDTVDRISWVNDAFVNFTGYSQQESKGQRLDNMLWGPKTDPATIKRIRRAARERKAIQEVVLNYAKNGQEYWLETTIDPILDNGKCTGFIYIYRDVSVRKHQEQKLKKSLKEKETLLSEIHHRVKNNLAVVSSMMQLQGINEEDEKFKNMIFDSVSRIKTMASIHEQLYQVDSFSSLDFTDNLTQLIKRILSALQKNRQINLHFDNESIKLGVNQALTCSLIVNEVVTNIVKHAFIDHNKGDIWINLKQNGDQIELNIKDNGIGLPEYFDKKEHETLGMQLVRVLSRQLEADYSYEPCNQGTIFTLLFQQQRIKGIGNSFL